MTITRTTVQKINEKYSNRRNEKVGQEEECGDAMQFSCLRFETLCPHEEVQKVKLFRIFWSFPGVKVSSHNILQSCFVRCWIRSLFTKTVNNMSLNCQKEASGISSRF